MILVDTSVWIDHFRKGSDLLKELLRNEEVLMHPFIIGELSLGSLRNRSEIMGLLGELPQVSVAEHGEVVALVERKNLRGTGIGWIDAHLLTSTLIANARLLTNDKPLRKATQTLGLAAA